jgi:protein phosphatase 2C family protein 2/3
MLSLHVNLSGGGGRVILLGDGTEITTEASDADMFDNDDEDKDRDFQVDRSNGAAQNAREETPGPQGSSAKETTESPSSVKTEKSEEGSSAKNDTTVPEKITASAK